MSDEELISQCCQGQNKAQKQLYERFAPLMLGVCMRYIPSRSEAQDVLHDAFIKVFEKLYTLRKAAALEDWVYHITINTAVSHLRSKKIVFDDVDLLPDTIAVEDYEPLSTKELLDAIQSLPDKYRLVFNLREVEGYDFVHIAHLLGIETVSVRSTLCRAKKMLQIKLKDYGY